MPVFAETQDKEFLEKGYHYAQKDYHTWVSLDEKKAGDTKLSRFFDFGDVRCLLACSTVPIDKLY
jgi:hypothetical protein